MDILPNTPAGIGRACDALRTGKMVIWPSPLWYGLSTTALDPAAVCHLYRAKRRDARKALLLLTQGAEDAERYGWINPVAAQLKEWTDRHPRLLLLRNNSQRASTSKGTTTRTGVCATRGCYGLV